MLYIIQVVKKKKICNSNVTKFHFCHVLLLSKSVNIVLVKIIVSMCVVIEL